MTVVSCPKTSYVPAHTSSAGQPTQASKQSRKGSGMLFIHHCRSVDFLPPPGTAPAALKSRSSIEETRLPRPSRNSVLVLNTSATPSPSMSDPVIESTVCGGGLSLEPSSTVNTVARCICGNACHLLFPVHCSPFQLCSTIHAISAMDSPQRN